MLSTGLDPTFGGGDGIERYVYPDETQLFEPVVLDDGSFLIGGSTGLANPFDESWDFALSRFLSDGSLDASFGVGGLVRTDLGSSDHGGDIVLQDDGKILQVGQVQTRKIRGPNQELTIDLALVRYLPDGQLDPSFGEGGVVIFSLGEDVLTGAEHLALQADGRIVVGGTILMEGVNQRDGFVTRFNTDGSLDPTFAGGTVTINLGGRDDIVRGLTIDPATGDVIAVGDSRVPSGDGEFQDTLFASRFAPDGSVLFVAVHRCSRSSVLRSVRVRVHSPTGQPLTLHAASSCRHPIRAARSAALVDVVTGAPPSGLPGPIGPCT